MLPLDGVRVVDLTRVLAGPFCAALRGDLGSAHPSLAPYRNFRCRDPAVRRHAPAEIAGLRARKVVA